jgi:hypothetical protein
VCHMFDLPGSQSVRKHSPPPQTVRHIKGDTVTEREGATCVVVDRLGDSVEEETSAETTGEEHAEPAARVEMSGGRGRGQ